VLLVASSAGEGCRFGCYGVEFQLPSICPVDANSCAGFECSDNCVYVASRRHASHVVYKGQTFHLTVPLFNPLYKPWNVNCEEDQRHRWALWYACFQRVSLNHIALNDHFDRLVREKPCHPSYEVSVHLLASHCVDQSPAPYARECCLDLHLEYASYGALAPGCVRSVNNDCRRFDCRPPFPASIPAIPRQTSSLSLFSQ